MPYKSARQRRYLHAAKPEVAAKFDAHEGKPDNRAKRFETESHAYNWRQRSGLKQHQPKGRGEKTAY